MESPAGGPYRHNAIDPNYGLVPQIAGTSLGKKILACNMDPPTVPLPSSVASHLPQIPSLPKNSVGTCQTIYEPRGAVGLSHRNALPNGILLITWMAGLTTGQTLHIISNNISVSKNNHTCCASHNVFSLFLFTLSESNSTNECFFHLYRWQCNKTKKLFPKAGQEILCFSFLCCIPTQPKRSSHPWQW